MSDQPTVVVADDQALVRGGFRMILNSAGIQVLAEAADGKEAVTAVLKHKPDVVLMDVRMPGMDGLQASRIIKRHDRLQHIPKIVMVSEFGREDVRTQAEEIGIDSYLLKPVNQSLLYDTLVDLFGFAGREDHRSRERKDESTTHDATGIRVLLVEDNAIPQNLSHFVAQHHETLRPDYALFDDGKPRVLITLLPPAQQPDRRPPSTTWNASPMAPA